MRIDLALASPSLAATVTGAFVDRAERLDPGEPPVRPGPSDHAPVVVELA